MWPLDPDSMAAYYLEQSWYDEFDGLPEDESTDLLIRNRKPKVIICKYCKQRGFHWKQLPNGQWRLFDQYGMHSCKEGTNAKQKGS